MERSHRHLTRRDKTLLSVGLCVLAAALVGAGAYASFTDTSAASSTIDTGTLTLDPGSSDTMSLAAVDMAPGDTMERLYSLVAGGTVETGGVTLDVTGSGSVLDTDATDGLHVAIDRCDEPWAGSWDTGHTCGTGAVTVLARRPAVTSGAALAGLVLDGTENHLRVTVDLPATAGNAFQGQSTQLDYVFTATQRTTAERK